MLTIEIELLTGRYVAQQANDRSRVEWPPHPARFFSAVVAALGHTSRRADDEREVVLLLENLGPPEIVASNLEGHRGARTVNTVFVPVNDTQLVGASFEKAFERLTKASAKQQPKAREALAKTLVQEGAASREDLERAQGLLPAGRSRQARSFPSFSPDERHVWFSWPDAALAPRHRSALERLLDRVTALGHSSSLVRCIATDALPPSGRATTLVPRVGGPHTIRWVAPGQLEKLDADFERHRGELPRVMPSRPCAYGVAAEPDVATPRSVFENDGWLMLSCDTSRRSSRFQSTRCVDIAKALHGALASRASQPAREIITGRRDGQPSLAPHLAILPLPDVGHRHAHGGVMGVALVFPRAASEDDRLHVIDALAGFLEAGSLLTLPRGAALPLKREEFPESASLREKTWVGPASKWATVTPIALDKNPGELGSPGGQRAAVATVEQACVRVGLPAPRGIELSLSPLLPGARSVREFDVFPREANRIKRLRVHALIDFGEAVLGPVALGAGRYVGLGLCRPLVERSR